MDTPAWLRDLFRAIDARDADGFAAFLGEDAVFRFGNADPVTGKETIRAAVAAFFASIASLQHQIVETWSADDAVICRGLVTYTRRDSSRLTVPFANIFKRRDGLIREYLIYVDASPLYAGR